MWLTHVGRMLLSSFEADPSSFSRPPLSHISLTRTIIINVIQYYQILSNIIKYYQILLNIINIFCNVLIYFKAQHILVAPMRVLWEGTCCTDTDIGIHWYCWISEDQKAPVVQNNVRQPELITGHLKSAKVTVSLVLISMSSIKIFIFWGGWNEKTGLPKTGQ